MYCADLLHPSAAAIGAVQERAGIGVSSLQPIPATFLASLHPARPQDAPDVQARSPPVEASGRPRGARPRAHQLSAKPLLCHRQPASRARLSSIQQWPAVRPDQQKIEQRPANAQALQQGGGLLGAVLAVGDMAPDQSFLAALATDRRRRSASAARSEPAAGAVGARGTAEAGRR